MSNLQMIEALCTLCEEQTRNRAASFGRWPSGWGSWGTPP